MSQPREMIIVPDLYPALSRVNGTGLLSQAVENWSGQDMLCGLAQYIHFNSVFGGGIAGLAGGIARRQDLFRDRSEAIDMIADQSVSIAAQVFYAAIDEFGRRKTHRQMAKDTLKSLARYYFCSPQSLLVMPATGAAIKRVCDGYYLKDAAGDADIFRALGFHLGSEYCADQEFNIIDRIVRGKHPLLRAALNEDGAYTWIQVHTVVEADHLEAAIDAANLALRYYVGSPAKAKAWVLEGFASFVSVQGDFMQSLVDIYHSASAASLLVVQQAQGQLTS